MTDRLRADLSTAAGEAWMNGELDSRTYFAMARRGVVPRGRQSLWREWLAMWWRSCRG